MRRLTLIGLSTAALALGPALLHAKSCPKVEINAVTGLVCPASCLRFGKRDVVEVCLIDQNPFRYKYTLTSKSEPVAETVKVDDIKGLFESPKEPTPAKGGGDEAAKEAKEAATAFKDQQQPPPKEAQAKADAERRKREQEQATCNAAWDQVAAFASNLKSVEGSVVTTLADLKSQHERADKAYETQRDRLFATPQPSRATLETAAKAAIIAAREAPEPGADLDQRIRKLRADANELLGRLREFADTDPLCYLRFAEAWRLTLADAVHWSTTFPAEAEQAIAKYKKHQRDLVAQAQKIEDILGSPTAFEQCRAVGGFDQPNDVTFTATRTAKEEKATAKEIASLKLNFGGGARFVLATGVVVAPRLATTTFARVPSIKEVKESKPDPANPGQTITETMQKTIQIVGETEQSRDHLLITGLLHTRLGDIDPLDASWFVTVGPASNGEIFVGGSVGFAESEVFLSAGFLRGKQDSLAGGFDTGDEIPETFEAELPIRKRWRWGFAVGLTVKIK